MESEYWDGAVDLIAELNGKASLESLFSLLLTPDEREAFGARLAVFRALLQGQMTQRQIASSLNVSIATITRCSNTLKHLPEPQRALMQQLLLGPS
ncbi:trp operon repressor [Ferrimonas sediminicola]|uniref:Trp operon repressor homolog n=1 Tax=Ferrimonas sediminicola TaxID=2569538 RepID=A0A4U1BEQ2_9GAMM|nr:trp operon repressor [Ferrimonas sediminicola]TKB49345.1 trp operon repressor [Ferrimonas sediminicola]